MICPIYCNIDGAVVLPNAKLCFQRWNVSLEAEAKLTRFNYGAVDLLFCETRFYVEHGKYSYYEPVTAPLQEVDSHCLGVEGKPKKHHPPFLSRVNPPMNDSCRTVFIEI